MPTMPDATTCLITDALNTPLGAVLQQQFDGTWHSLSFFSKKMMPAETRYSTFDRELLVIYLAIKYFRQFLEGRNFHVHTDDKPLTHVINIPPDFHCIERNSRLSAKPPIVDFAAMAKSQAVDPGAAVFSLRLTGH